jgi:hypothetical protein
MRRRWLLIFPALALLTISGVSIYWYVVARQVSRGTLAWIAQRRAEGWMVSASGPSLTGWPRTAAVVLAGFRIVGGEPDIPGGVSWQTDHLLIGLDLLHPDHVDALTSGEQRIGPLSGPVVEYTTELTRLRIPLQSSVPTAELTARAFRVGSAGLAIGTAHALFEANPMAGKAQAALNFALDTRDVTLPPHINWPLGRHIASLSANAAVNGPIPPPHGFTADTRAWRDGGGTIDMRRVDLHWGPLDGSLRGTASLDQDLQLLASGDLDASNYAETLDVLAARGIIGADAALAAKAVLSLLAAVPASGPAHVTVPFTIRDGILAVRGIPLARLPTLQWPSQ